MEDEYYCCDPFELYDDENFWDKLEMKIDFAIRTSEGFDSTNPLGHKCMLKVIAKNREVQTSLAKLNVVEKITLFAFITRKSTRFFLEYPFVSLKYKTPFQGSSKERK